MLCIGKDSASAAVHWPREHREEQAGLVFLIRLQAVLLPLLLSLPLSEVLHSAGQTMFMLGRGILTLAVCGWCTDNTHQEVSL